MKLIDEWFALFDQNGTLIAVERSLSDAKFTASNQFTVTNVLSRFFNQFEEWEKLEEAGWKIKKASVLAYE